MQAMDILLSNWNWLHGKPWQEACPTVSVATDATLSASAGIIVNSPHPPLELTNTVEPAAIHLALFSEDQTASINMLEMLGALDALQHFEHLTAGKCLGFTTDNTTAYHYFKKGGGSTQHLADIAWQLTTWLITNKIRLCKVEWVSSARNALADAYSGKNPLSYTIPSTVIHKTFAWMRRAMLPQPNLEAFASHNDHFLTNFITELPSPGATHTNFLLLTSPY